MRTLDQQSHSWRAGGGRTWLACFAILWGLLGCAKTITPYKMTKRTKTCTSHIECYNRALEKLQEARDYWQAERANILPAGTIIAMPFDMKRAPDGWLMCKGQWVSCEGEYRRLCKALKSRVKQGLFQVPDLQGYFMRGYDPRGTVDPDGKKRKAGDVQADAVGPHRHHFYTPFLQTTAGSPWWDGLAFAKFEIHGVPRRYDTESNGSRETRPKNVSVVYLIKY